MKFIDDRTIQNNKEITELDSFVFKFIDIIKKYSDYVVISGYVSIILGRSRATEDVDIFIREITYEQFTELLKELKKNDFWCLNGDKEKDLYAYFEDSLALRFGEKGRAIPNMEVKIAKTALNKEAFIDKITVKTKIGDVFISSLDRQIAFKRYYLGSKKDEEDALHIENTFKEHIHLNRINEYKKMIENELSDSR